MKYLLVVLAFGLLISCSNSKEAEIDELKDEVMVVHDEVMPLMDPLYRIRRDLQKRISVDSAQISPESRAEIIAAMQEIQLAEDAMMNWMRNFNLTFVGESDSLTFAYFIEKKQSIEKVSKEMNAAQATGERLLSK